MIDQSVYIAQRANHEAGRNTMTTTGRKMACVVTLVFVAGGAFLSATRFATLASAAPAAPPTQPPADAGRPGQSPPKEEPTRIILLHGKVFGPENRPVSGARLCLSRDEWTAPVELGTSDADG